MTLVSLYSGMIEAGVPFIMEQRDLLCKDTPAARNVLMRHSRSAITYRCKEGEMWLKIPKVYRPWWRFGGKR